jgi:hypothetical protein
LTEQILRDFSNLGANLPNMSRALLLIAVSINGCHLYPTISINGCQGLINHLYKWLARRKTYKKPKFLKSNWTQA